MEAAHPWTPVVLCSRAKTSKGNRSNMLACLLVALAAQLAASARVSRSLSHTLPHTVHKRMWIKHGALEEVKVNFINATHAGSAARCRATCHVRTTVVSAARHSRLPRNTTQGTTYGCRRAL